MRIEIKGRNVTVGDELRSRIEKRFLKIAKQVSELAEMEVELSEERNPSIADSQVAVATLRLKGVTLRAQRQHDPLDQRGRRRAHAPSEAPPRHAPPAPRDREERAAAESRLTAAVSGVGSRVWGPPSEPDSVNRSISRNAPELTPFPTPDTRDP